MKPLSFEVLDLARPDVHTSAAARLLARECADRFHSKIEWNTKNPEQNVQSFIEQFFPLVITYGLIEPPHGLIAAASVIHNLEQDHDTNISNLAVYPALRRRGYGTRLVRHIAEQALDNGSVKLTYYTNHDYWDRADEKGFLHSLGFYPGGETDFEVPVAELLARTES